MKSAASPVALALAAAGALALSGCGDKNAPPPEATQSGSAIAEASGAIVESQFGTPVKDRVATLGFLNKRNNITQNIVLKAGESRRIGNAIIKLATCEKTAPWEDPPQTGAFVQLFVEERATTEQKLAWHKVFSGWLYKDSPSVNVVEHAVYDVWIKDCAMKFPGEDQALPVASASSAAKPAGSPAPAPSASSSESPAAAAAPAAPTSSRAADSSAAE